MAGISLKCGDCGILLRTVTEAEDHAKQSKHSSFEESSEPVLSLACFDCGNICNSQMERDLHTKKRGHNNFVDPALRPATKSDRMRECLRSLKNNHMDDEAKVKAAFNALFTFAKNVAVTPDEEKYRRIRITNEKFQERVGKLKGSIEFLELCGFEKDEGGEFLYLSREKVDMAVLKSAGTELNNAINNPSFGVQK